LNIYNNYHNSYIIVIILGYTCIKYEAVQLLMLWLQLMLLLPPCSSMQLYFWPGLS